MKTIIIILIVLLSVACTKQVNEVNKEKSISVFDSLKAEKYGADEYGMKTYVMAFLKRGPNGDLDSIKRAELQTAHLKILAEWQKKVNWF